MSNSITPTPASVEASDLFEFEPLVQFQESVLLDDELGKLKRLLLQEMDSESHAQFRARASVDL